MKLANILSAQGVSARTNSTRSEAGTLGYVRSPFPFLLGFLEFVAALPHFAGEHISSLKDNT